MKVLVFGSNGLVGSSLKSTLPNESIFDEIKFSSKLIQIYFRMKTPLKQF